MSDKDHHQPCSRQRQPTTCCIRAIHKDISRQDLSQLSYPLQAKNYHKSLKQFSQHLKLLNGHLHLVDTRENIA